MIKNIKLNLIVILTVVILSGYLCSCNTDNVKSVDSTEIISKMKIGVLLYKQDDTFIYSLFSNIEEAAKNAEQSHNVKITVNSADGKGSQSIQNDQIDKFIEQGYDVICVNLVDRTAAATVIDKARNADVPIIFFNREPVKEDLERWEKVFYVGAVASQSGIMQGRMVADAFIKSPEIIDKNNDGKIQYVMLEGEHGHQDALLRTDYAIKTVAADGIDMDKLANDTANWQRGQASAKMTQWISTFGDKVEVVFSNNDDMALGAIDAYIAAGIESRPIFVGIDGTAEAIDAIKNGTMYGTVLNDSKGQAEAMFNLCYSIAFNRDINTDVKLIREKYVRMPYKPITLENIDEAK